MRANRIPSHSSFRRRPESRGVGGGKTAASEMARKQSRGEGSRSALRSRHIPDSDPGCALQSTSMPALHRRNVPNRRPKVDGGMRKCSAVEDFARRGACPPLGSGWGVAESAVPIRWTKPQLRLFTPRRAGTSRHERLARKHVPDSDPG